MQEIVSLAYSLHEMLLSSNEYKALKEAENIMLNDKISSQLINEYHTLQQKYNFNKTDEVLTMLSNAKLNMDNNELVIKYKNAYKQYQILVGNITSIVFEGYKSDTLLDKIIKAK